MKRIIILVLFLQTLSFTQETKLHTYRLELENVNGKPLKNIKITYSIISDVFESQSMIKEGEKSTSSNGVAVITVKVPKDWELSSNDILNRLNEGRPHYSSMLSYHINDSIHYPVTGTLKSYFGGLSTYSPDYYESEQEWYDLTQHEVQKKIIALSKTGDYFSNDFKNSFNDKSIIEKVIDTLMIDDFPENLTLEYESVNFETFKDNRFLSFGFMSENIYNSLRLNEYEVAKRILNESIYSLIKKIDSFINFQNKAYGLCIKSKFYLKNFIDDYSKNKKYKLSFYFSQKSLREYLLKNISRQKLLSQSDILLNGDKIDIKY